MFRRGLHQILRFFSARGCLAAFSRQFVRNPASVPALFLFLPPLTADPLFAANHLDAAKITELLLWILAFATYVILGLIILIRISRGIKQGKSGNFDYGSETEMFRDLYRKRLISPEEYKKIQTGIRNRLVGDVLNRSPSASAPAETENLPHDEELEKILRLQALLRGEKRRR